MGPDQILAQSKLNTQQISMYSEHMHMQKRQISLRHLYANMLKIKKINNS